MYPAAGILAGIFLILTFLPLGISGEATAQTQREDLLEIIAEKKRQFLINRLDLASHEQASFFGLYDEFLLATLRLNRERLQRTENLRKEINFGDDPTAMAEIAVRAGMFEERYLEVKDNFYSRFRDLLGDKRFASLILAEIDFQQEIDRLRNEFREEQQMRASNN